MSATDPYFDASSMVDDEFLDEVTPEDMDEAVADAPNADDYQKVYTERGAEWGTDDPDVTFRISVDAITPVMGNIFYPEKLTLFAKLISSGRYPTFGAPWAYANVVDLGDVAESQRAERSGEDMFWSHGMTRAYTTDDEDLDEYLADPEGYLDENAEIDWNSSDEEEAAARAALREEMDELAKTASNEGWGDLGSLTVQLRDGNHRAFAAQIAGEGYVWVRIADMEELSGDVLEQLS